jgi:hypothetical protein
MSRTVLSLGALVFGVTVAAAPVPKTLKKREPLLPLAIGAKWEYVSVTNHNQIVEIREITAVEEKDGVVIATQKNNNLTQIFRATAEEVVVTASNGVTYKNPRVILKAGMKEGDSWEWNNGGSIETRTVGQAEKVSTPAGEFTATPMTYNNGNQGDTITVWYADQVGLIRVDYDNQPYQVLKAFTPGKEKEAKK